jgi:small subunit ribosomal protein S11
MSTENPENEEVKAEEATKKAVPTETPKVEAPKAEKADVTTAEEAESTDTKPEDKKGDSAIQELLGDDLANVKIRRAKGSKNITHGIVHVIATFNNTKVSVTDTKGNVISWSSAGKCNFRGSRKSTAYAAQVVTQEATRAAMAHGLKEVEVHLKGPGLGRDSAVRALQALGMIIVSIVDKTPVPHNGCRPPKRRRV